jgi:hypothetical protein
MDVKSMTMDQLYEAKMRLGNKSQELQTTLSQLKLYPDATKLPLVRLRLNQINADLTELKIEISKRVSLRIQENSEYEPPVTKKQLCLRLLSLVEKLRREIKSAVTPAERHYKTHFLADLEAIWGEKYETSQSSISRHM